VPNVIVKGLGRVLFPDNLGQKEIADILASKGDELLDMSIKARAARVTEQGFDRDIYHKTWGENFGDKGDGFTEFSKDRMQQSDYGYAGKGVYATPQPLGGSTYGNTSLPLKTNMKNPYIRTMDNWQDELDPYQWIPANGDKYDSMEDASAAWTDMMQKKGHGGFVDETSANGEIVVFDPANIRSVNAAFDPALKDSSNLLASAAPVALGLGALGSGEEAEAGALSSFLKKAHPKLSISITERGNNIILDKVIVPKELRDSGQGSRFMEDLLSAADSQGRTIGLSPSTDFGGTKSGLQRFYKKHGFVPNKGKNRNFEISESLIRSPKGLLAGAAGIGATGQSFASQVQSRQGETPTEQARRLLVRPEDKITADEFPKLEAIGDFLDKYGQTPIGPAFEGIAQYLRDFGREDMNTKQRVKSAFMAALDVI